MRWSCSPWWAKATGVRVAAVGRGTRDLPREQLPKGENGAGSPSCLTCSSVMHLRRVRRPPRPRYSRERWRHTRRQLGVEWTRTFVAHTYSQRPLFSFMMPPRHPPPSSQQRRPSNPQARPSLDAVRASLLFGVSSFPLPHPTTSSSSVDTSTPSAMPGRTWSSVGGFESRGRTRSGLARGR